MEAEVIKNNELPINTKVINSNKEINNKVNIDKIITRDKKDINVIQKNSDNHIKIDDDSEIKEKKSDRDVKGGNFLNNGNGNNNIHIDEQPEIKVENNKTNTKIDEKAGIEVVIVNENNTIKESESNKYNTDAKVTGNSVEKMIEIEINTPNVKIIEETIDGQYNGAAPNIINADYLKSQTAQENDKIRTVGGRVIPKLEPIMAIGLLILNIFFPGLGTMIVGCVSPQKEVCCGWFCIGFLQMIFASCIFGWVWAIISACAIVSVANDPDYSDNVIVVVKQSN